MSGCGKLLNNVRPVNTIGDEKEREDVLTPTQTG